MLLSMHHGYGTYLRNSWGLWKEKSDLRDSFVKLGINHPDDISSIILVSFHRKLNNQDISLDDQIKKYQEYWNRLEIEQSKNLGDSIIDEFDF